MKIIFALACLVLINACATNVKTSPSFGLVIEKEYEIEFASAEHGKFEGEIEWEESNSGEYHSIKIKVKAPDLEDGTIAELSIDKKPLGQITFENGKGKLKLKSIDGDIVPDLGKASMFTMTIDGQTMIAIEIGK